jgi:hypothetical protein
MGKTYFFQYGNVQERRRGVRNGGKWGSKWKTGKSRKDSHLFDTM